MDKNEVSKAGLPPALVWFAGALVFAVAMCLGGEAICRRIPGLNVDPYIYPLGREHFPDFLHMRGRFEHFHSLAFFTFDDGSAYLYPAPVALVYKAFFLWPKHALRMFLGFIGACAALGCLGMGRSLCRKGVHSFAAYSFPFAVLCCSYPLWTDVKQANMEIVIALFTSLGIVFFLKEQEFPSAICFGLAASLKIYPAILLGLFLARRRYGAVAAGLAAAVLSTLVSLWALAPEVGTSWRYIEAGVLRFRTDYILVKRPEIGTDHSLFAWVKLWLDPLPGPPQMGHVLTSYMLFASLAGCTLFFTRIWKLPSTNQVLCLAIASVLLPPVSFEYTLLNMIAPIGMMALLVVEGRRTGQTLPREALLLVCSALLLAPLPEWIVLGRTIDGQIKSLALQVMFATALLTHLPVLDGVDASLSPQPVADNQPA